MCTSMLVKNRSLGVVLFNSSFQTVFNSVLIRETNNLVIKKGIMHATTFI